MLGEYVCMSYRYVIRALSARARSFGSRTAEGVAEVRPMSNLQRGLNYALSIGRPEIAVPLAAIAVIIGVSPHLSDSMTVTLILMWVVVTFLPWIVADEEGDEE